MSVDEQVKAIALAVSVMTSDQLRALEELYLVEMNKSEGAARQYWRTVRNATREFRLRREEAAA